MVNSSFYYFIDKIQSCISHLGLRGKKGILSLDLVVWIAGRTVELECTVLVDPEEDGRLALLVPGDPIQADDLFCGAARLDLPAGKLLQQRVT